MKFRILSALAFFACTASSCALFTPDERIGEVTPSEEAKDSYLEQGPTTKIDISPGQQSLLEVLKEAKEQIKKMEQERSELSSQLKSAQMRLDDSDSSLKNSRADKSALEAELKSSQANLRDLEARLLDAALEKAKLQRKALELEILNVRNKLGKLARSEDQ